MTTEIKEDTTTFPITNNDGDHEKFAHYVKKPKGVYQGASSYVLDAMVNGYEVEALCGKKWVPTRDPKRFPVCPECQAMVDRVLNRDNG